MQKINLTNNNKKSSILKSFVFNNPDTFPEQVL